MAKKRFWIFVLIALLLVAAALVVALALSRGGQNVYKGAQLVACPAQLAPEGPGGAV